MSDKVNTHRAPAVTAPAFSAKKYGRYSDLVDALQVTRQTIHRWAMTDPDFPQPIKRGQTVLFNMAAVEAWLNGEEAQ